MQNRESQRIYGGFFVRMFARLIDLVLAGLASLLLSIPVILICRLLPGDIESRGILFQYTICDIWRYLVRTAYFVTGTFVWGRTVGKRILNLRVVSANEGEKLNLLNSIYRETVGRYLSAILLIGYIMCGIDEEKRALHDRLCDTRVIYDKGSPKLMKKEEQSEDE